MQKVAVIHTSPVSLNELKALFAELLPEVEMINIIDDSLLEEVKRNNGITSAIIGRMCLYGQAAQSMGVDLILNQCSSVGESADLVKQTVTCPLLKIDEPMAEEAVRLGSRIGVIATVGSTMKPSCNLIRTKAEQVGKVVEIKEYLVAGALDILMKEKNQEKHNELVLKEIKKAEQECDVIVLAQGSMTVMLPYLEGISKPVLTSPRRAVERVKQMLAQQA